MRLLEVKQPNIIVVYGGGFQPFHEGHASSYREAKAAFPGAYFFVAASNVTTERPFEFKEKQFLAQQAGVVDPFIQVGTMSYVNDNGRKVTSTPLNPLEVLQKFNPEKDILVIVRSERDPMKTTDVSYYQPWQGQQGAEPFSKHAYVFVTKKHDFSIAGNPVYSGSQVRELYSGADDKTKLSILQDLYPQSRQLAKIKQIFDKRLAVNEGWFKNTAASLALGAAAMGGAQANTTVDDPSWHSGKYPSHVKSDHTIQKQTGSSSTHQKRISDVTGPNAAGEYKVTVTQNGKIASQYVTKTPPPDWMMKEQDLDEDAGRTEAQAAYMQGECMILAVAINQLNPKRYPIGYIWEYNTSAGAPDMQLDDDEWDDLTPQEQEEISQDISRHSVVHAYVRDRDTGEYIDARGRHKTLPNLWGRLGVTRFDEFPGTARELIDITAHGDWDEVGEKVDFKRGQPAFDSLSGPAGVKRAQEYAVKYLGVEGSKNKLRIGDIVRAVDDGKRVQGEVIGISSDYEEVELWLSGVNDFNPITVNVRDIEPMSEQGVTEASLATMRDYFAGDEKAQDPLEITKQRLYYDKKAVANKRKEFRSQWEYEQWLKKHNLKQISDSEEYNEEEQAANLLEYLRKIHKRWAIVSKKGGRPLVYFKGDGKPSKDWVEKQERRINYFKHKK